MDDLSELPAYQEKEYLFIVIKIGIFYDQSMFKYNNGHSERVLESVRQKPCLSQCCARRHRSQRVSQTLAHRDFS